MKTTQINIDCYNKNVSVLFDEFLHVFSSYDRFVELTGFERNEAVIVSYELERNLFVVEYAGGVVLLGKDTPEIKWVENNLRQIKQAAQIDHNETAPKPLKQRFHREAMLAATDWVFTRHQEQLILGITPTFSQQQLEQVSEYRQQLRDLPTDILEKVEYDPSEWPVLPSFLA